MKTEYEGTGGVSAVSGVYYPPPKPRAIKIRGSRFGDEYFIYVGDIKYIRLENTLAHIELSNTYVKTDRETGEKIIKLMSEVLNVHDYT